MKKTILKRSAAILTALLLALPVSAAEYTGQFTDVPQTAWYYSDVADAYSHGLISGKSDTAFDPDGTLTIAQAVKLAVACHQTLVTGKTSGLTAAS